MFFYFSQVIPIDKRLVPHLRRLTMIWEENIIYVQSIETLFDSDVFFSLTHFTLWASITGPDILRSLLSKLSPQCSYRFNVTWDVTTVVSLAETSNILSNTFRQLKGPVPIELMLSLEKENYYIRATTIPRMSSHLCVDSYLYKNTAYG